MQRLQSFFSYFSNGLFVPFLPIATTEAPSHDWLPIIISAVTALVTILTGLYASKGKQKTSDFEAVMQERRDLTDDIREELKRKREEFQEEMKQFHEEMQKCFAKVKSLQEEAEEKDCLIEDMSGQIDELKKKNKRQAEKAQTEKECQSSF